MIKIAILGYGNIGKGVYSYIKDNREKIKSELGQEIFVDKILDTKDFDELEIKNKLVRDFSEIEKDDLIDVVIECMGGIGASYEFVKRAILSNKSVVTSNKALVATHGSELLLLAKEKQVKFLFEASVGGGIPIIRNISSTFSLEKIEEIEGILNGTTNFVLTKMEKEKLSLEKALELAREKGYAEANSEDDIKAYDTARKIAILNSLVLKKEFLYENLYIEGIENIDEKDFVYANELGYSIKLLAKTTISEDKVYSCVSPRLVSKTSPFYLITDVFNGVRVKGNKLGDVIFYGQGAGKDATASAVVSNICDIIKDKLEQKVLWEEEEFKLASILDIENRYLLRVKLSDKKDEYLRCFNVEKTYFLEDEFAFITDKMSEKDFLEKYMNIEDRIKFIRLND